MPPQLTDSISKSGPAGSSPPRPTARSQENSASFRLKRCSDPVLRAKEKPDLSAVKVVIDARRTVWDCLAHHTNLARDRIMHALQSEILTMWTRRDRNDRLNGP